MDPAHPSANKLLSLQEAAERLSVSVDTLLLWNKHQILTPTITLEGTIGYTEQQISQFQGIRGLMQAHIASVSNSSVNLQIPNTNQTPSSFEPVKPIETEVITKQKAAPHPHSWIATSIVAISILLVLATALQVTAKSLLTFSGQAKTSTYAFTQATSPLPIQSQTTNKSIFTDKNSPLFAQKLPTPAPKKVKNELPMVAGLATMAAILKPTPTVQAQEDTTTGQASTFFSKSTTDTNSVFDAKGNIKGDANNNVLAALQGIGAGLEKSNQNQTNSNAENIVILLFLAGVSLVFFKQKNQLFALLRSQHTMMPAMSSQASVVSQKVLEVEQKTDGTVVVYMQGKEFKISKPELYSESDQFISRLMEISHHTKEMEYIYTQDEKIRLNSPLSRLVTRLGFVGIKRDLFFPRTAKDRVLFRRYITQNDLSDMNLTTNEIITELSQQFAKLN